MRYRNSLAAIHRRSYCLPTAESLSLVVVQVPPLDERIRELCAKATAQDSEVEAVLVELQAALREHNQFVRQMTAQTAQSRTQKGCVIA